MVSFKKGQVYGINGNGCSGTATPRMAADAMWAGADRQEGPAWLHYLDRRECRAHRALRPRRPLVEHRHVRDERGRLHLVLSAMEGQCPASARLPSDATEPLMQLTEEQQRIVGSTSRRLAVQAGAGAAKTTTLCAYAAARPRQRIL